MWSWERERRVPAGESDARIGTVTVGGEVAVQMGAERRRLALCTPGGCVWRPREGERVLVLKTDDPTQACVLGAVGSVDDLEPGQFRLSGNGCTLLLGDVLELNGTVRINGELLEEMIRRIVTEGGTNG